MNHPLILTGLAVLLTTSSCTKHQRLLNERAGLEEQINQGQEELKALDAKFATLGADFVTAMVVFERQTADWQKKMQLLRVKLRVSARDALKGRLV